MWMRKKRFNMILDSMEEFIETIKEMHARESKLVATLEAENKLLRERLLNKDIFVENLLAQLLGGASIKNLISAPPKEESKPLVTPAVQRYIDRKKEYADAKANGKAPLP
jgi:hypothetical protein